MNHSLGLSSGLKGITSGISANLAWGLAFLVPVIFPHIDTLKLALGRYIIFGLLSLCLIFFQPKVHIKNLNRQVLCTALIFAFAGHLGYYVFLIEGIRHLGAPLSTVIIGTLPVTVAVTGNWQRKEFPLSDLLLPLGLIIIGLILVNLVEINWNTLSIGHNGINLLFGITSTLLALILWTTYAVSNANFLRKHSEISSALWSALMGAGALVLSFIALAIMILARAFHLQGIHLIHLTNQNVLPLIIASMILGIIVSWMGTLLWNRTSGSVPISIAGQLAVIQMIAGLIYVFLWEQRIPTALEILGILLLISGVLISIKRAKIPCTELKT